MARKGECKIVLENYLQRKCSYIWQIFTKYKKEYAQLMLYEDGSSVIEFKTDVNGRVKFRYEMESCIGVYLRVQMDQARADWPVNSNPECCFTLINHDDNNVFLVADESKIAHRWAWKLSEYSKAPQTVRKSNEEFSINDLIDVFDVLNDEPSLLSCDPSSWKFLGRNLGLADDTLQKIEDFHDTTEDRLYFCLLKWIQRSDKVDEKGGPTHLILADSLKKMKKEEIAKRVFANFSHKSKSLLLAFNAPCVLQYAMYI
ncbi:PREDICTED: uncharacterized protein LOC109584508 [Amphimedon queenslandica]|uniref:Death domain-containing protein n=1 Tax=Amphimedon queenslandica TaxID=400682 RepID=A0AAN0JFU5_AMPQE|nr:PREDICTED: uncharacterized protein LOC109584508 [Amphimedon queenslandica]|eukprot:XP_019855829.1 PREDICTED: uncharacterized protein LOC109584508 [Amphimedon queenslandica]